MKQQRILIDQSNNDFYYDHRSAVQTKKFYSHCHNGYEIIFFRSGIGEYQIEERSYSLQKYDLIITRPWHYHNIDIDTTENYDRYDILVNSNSHLTKLLDTLIDRFEVINCANSPNIINCFKKMDQYLEHLPKEDFNIVLHNLLVEVCYNLIIEEQPTAKERVPTSKAMEQAIDYIHKNLLTIKDIKEISDYVFISENHFFRLFKEEMNVSPKKYITAKRLLYAQSLIQGGEHPTQIFEKCGFNNYISFYQRYVDFFGYPPSEEIVKF